METSAIINPVDLRLRQLSYSSSLLFHSCPRKFQLYKLQAARAEGEETQSITFAYGHIVGHGIQLILEGKSIDEIYWTLFQEWDCDLFAANLKQNKSFWQAMIAIQKFVGMLNSGFLRGWELVYWEGRPAVELSFLIHLPDGFVYRGFVDAVLKNTESGEVRVLEVKTTSSNNLTGAEYKNSAQAIGYSIVLDVIAPDVSSYSVLYLPYKTKTMEYDPMEFPKSYLQRALWIQELLLEVETILMYERANVYPMHGESCYNWYRECEYFGTCTLSTGFLTQPLTAEDEMRILEDQSKYQIKLNVSDLIAAQLSKEV